MKRWRVRKTGSGGGVYDDVKVVAGGALLCFEKRGEKPFPEATSEFEVMVPVAAYGPGMWITAKLEEE